MTQGRQLIAHLKRKPHTYAEMMEVLKWQSCSPWRRAAEALGPDEEIKKGVRMVRDRKLVTWRVVKATKWTA